LQTTNISRATLILKVMVLLLYLGILIGCSPADRSPATPTPLDARGSIDLKNSSGEDDSTASETPASSVLDRGSKPDRTRYAAFVW